MCSADSDAINRRFDSFEREVRDALESIQRRAEKRDARMDALEARLMTPDQVAATVAKAISDQGVLTLVDLKHWARETFSPKRIAILLAMVAGALTSVEKIVSYLTRIWGG